MESLQLMLKGKLLWRDFKGIKRKDKSILVFLSFYFDLELETVLFCLCIVELVLQQDSYFQQFRWSTALDQSLLGCIYFYLQ